MRTLLVAAALRDRQGHDAAVAHLRAHCKPETRVVPSLDPPPAGVDWEAVRACEGGWGGIGPWVARTFDGVCVVPVDGARGLSRIVFAMAAETLAAGKPVLIARGDPVRVLRVARLEVLNAGEFKGVYGRAEVIG